MDPALYSVTLLDHRVLGEVVLALVAPGMDCMVEVTLFWVLGPCHGGVWTRGAVPLWRFGKHWIPAFSLLPPWLWCPAGSLALRLAVLLERCRLGCGSRCAPGGR